MLVFAVVYVGVDVFEVEDDVGGLDFATGGFQVFDDFQGVAGVDDLGVLPSWQLEQRVGEVGVEVAVSFVDGVAVVAAGGLGSLVVRVFFGDVSKVGAGFEFGQGAGGPSVSICI